MVFDPLLGIFHHGAGFHDKGPVRALGQQQLSACLLQRPLKHWVAVVACVGVGKLGHVVAGIDKGSVDPLVTGLQPHLVVTLVTPGGGTGLTYLLLGEAGEVFFGVRQGVGVLVVGGFCG